MKNNFVIGVDYGTDSVRTLIANAKTGEEVAISVFEFPRWKKKLYCDPLKNQFRQHPLDYLEGLEYTIKTCVAAAGKEVAENVLAISIATTGSTPVAVNGEGTPLALLSEFENNPNAMFLLWKDHTSLLEAEEINAQAKKFEINYLDYSGGSYSSEWFWAKLLHILRSDEQIKNACVSALEHSDWMPFVLTGGKNVSDIKRNVCAAGHKGMWSKANGGFPPEAFFSTLDPLLKGFVERMEGEVFTADQSAGNLSAEWAARLGLSTRVKVGIGAIDAHVGAVGGEIEPYVLSKVIGTSTCDMLVVPSGQMTNVVKGISGQVEGSIIPGMVGLEAGQSAFGDIYAWFKEVLLWPLKNELKKENPVLTRVFFDQLSKTLLSDLEQEAAAIEISGNAEIAIDWFNGRRNPDANPLLKGALLGLTLGSDAPYLYRALVESTCFGAKKIINRYREEGVPVKAIIAVGGIPRKSSFIMQMLSDIMEMPIKVHASEQSIALGATMLAATVAGVHPSVEEAIRAMGKGFDIHYKPNPTLQEVYRLRFKKYEALCSDLEGFHK